MEMSTPVLDLHQKMGIGAALAACRRCHQKGRPEFRAALCFRNQDFSIKANDKSLLPIGMK